MIPEDLYYSEEHEWVRVDDDVVTIGITDYAQDALGDIVYVELPAVGDVLQEGAVVGELESTKSVSDIFCPVAGEVIARNDALDGGPEVINSDPYGEGWLLKLRVTDDDPTAGLLTAERYTAITSA
ncbi:glycine cleavage system H protein [Aeromicrobium marinum DSM 15272]|uniref:Glycine cleavage system H protein n=1 Tax=Aeromicrobium marinum DSM 15272 TaxID=585531 RepID=E2S9R1_9ACTN|nr:glycine cleavage system protein GcvH [Aeromicrobium marinum]EFQ83985.1 glycine cleavage system H protein [Aeromicrobium marinum DSM 15272]